MRRTRLKVLLSLTAVVAIAASMVVVSAIGASAVAFHGITPQKACNTTTQIGSPYTCAYKITNADDNNEDIVVTSVTDVVHSAGGNVSSGNVIGLVSSWTLGGGAFCTGTPVTSCTLPNKGDSITSSDFSFYTVTAADYAANPQHLLADDIAIAWSEPVCVNGGCPVGGQSGTTGASTTVTNFKPSITTLLSATSVDPGTLVHDSATLTGASPDAGGTVSYAVYSDNTCTTLVQALGTKTVTNGSVPDSDNWTAVSGDFWFQASYSGDASNDPAKSVCTEEPIHVNSPGVSIVKKTNDADANDPNGADVPNIKPGDPVTWTYIVTNTGSTHVAKADVHVTDNTTGVTPTFSSEQSGNGDQIFDPGEIWIYTATGTALDLTQPPPAGTNTQANACTHNNTEPGRTAYINIGKAEIPGDDATDPSSYCNPPPPPGVQNLTPGFWKNHEAATTALLPLFLGNYKVDTFAKAKTILNGMGCGAKADGPINCMAGMLLAAELNLAQGGNACIQTTLNTANALLVSIGYSGYTTYNVSAAVAAQAKALHDTLSAYNVDAVIQSC